MTARTKWRLAATLVAVLGLAAVGVAAYVTAMPAWAGVIFGLVAGYIGGPLIFNLWRIGDYS